MRRVSVGRTVLLISIVAGLAMSASAQDRGAYGELLELFGEFRAFSQAGYDGDIAGDEFVLKEFMDEFYGLGALPMSLIRWEMTGYDDEIKTLW